MSYRNRNILGVIVALALAVLIAALAVPARAAEQFDVAAAEAAYNHYDDACAAGNAKACDNPQFDSLARKLSDAGYTTWPHHVWISVDQLAFFRKWVDGTNAWARLDVYATYSNRYMALSHLHRYGITDAQIVAWWNANHEIIRDSYPLVWATMSELLDGLALEHQYEPGQTYKLAY